MSQESNPYNHLLYARGYIITDKAIQPPHPHWQEVIVNRFHIYYDPLNDLELVKHHNNWLVILGTAIDLNLFSSKKKQMAQKLLNYYSTSNEKFFNYLDAIAGRYFIFYGTNDDAKILADATGMRSVFYSLDQTVIASHCELVQKYVQAPHSPLIDLIRMSRYSAYHLPGHYTPYDKIFLLTPNTLFQLSDKRIIRFFPREVLVSDSTEKVIEEISFLSKGQIEPLLKTQKSLLLSLSAGIDSRTSLSLAKDYLDRFHFFTYYKTNVERSYSTETLFVDRDVVGDMVDNLNLQHNFLEIDYSRNDEDFDQFSQVMGTNTFMQHGFRLAQLYYRHYNKGYLHIRSNITAIGKFHFENLRSKFKKFDSKTMVHYYSPEAIHDEDVNKALTNFYETIKFDHIKNYDPYNMLYWEYRMGSWHSQVLLESDVAHETHSFFNARNILKLLLSVKPRAKKQKSILYGIIDMNWPVLNYWKVNSKEITTRYDSQFDDYGLSLNSAVFTNSSIHDKNRSVPIEKIIQNNRLKFFMLESGPKSGDFARVDIPLDTRRNQGYTCIAQLRSPYENKTHRGRIVYQVLLNDIILVEEDICDWAETNQVQIKWTAELTTSTLSVRILAKRNCEPWSWGDAGTILIERVTLRKDDHNIADTKVSVSSPHSIIFREDLNG